jgi:hypothetical protein
MDELLAITAYELKTGKITKEEITSLNSKFSQVFLENTLHGRGFLKPNGYPGDCLFLDRIYTDQIAADPKFAIWDEYVQQNGAPGAVRNRKEYFKHLAKAKTRSASKVNVLNIISGSGIELAELYNSVPIKNIHTTCVEIDDEAIEFLKELNRDHLEHIMYINSNIFRYRTTNTFDFLFHNRLLFPRHGI